MRFHDQRGLIGGGLVSERVENCLECEWLNLHASILPQWDAIRQRRAFGFAATKWSYPHPSKRRFGPVGILHLYILIWREVEGLTAGGRAADFLASARRHLVVCPVDNPFF